MSDNARQPAAANAAGGTHDADDRRSVATSASDDDAAGQARRAVIRRDSGASTLTEATVGDVDIAQVLKQQQPALQIANYNVKQAEIDVWVFRRVREWSAPGWGGGLVEALL